MSAAQTNDSVLTSTPSNSVLLITMNLPSAANALISALLKGLAAALDMAAQEQYRAVVVTGAGRNFCAGADLLAYAEDPAALGLREVFHPVLLRIRSLQKPVIAAVNGAAAGGGMGLALASDIRIMSDTAYLRPSWATLGLVPDLGASWILMRLIGYSRSFDWLTSGSDLSAGRAVDLGLASEVVSADRLVEHACDRAAALAAKPGMAVALTKSVLRASLSNGFADQLEAEADFQALASRSLLPKASQATRLPESEGEVPKLASRKPDAN